MATIMGDLWSVFACCDTDVVDTTKKKLAAQRAQSMIGADRGKTWKAVFGRGALSIAPDQRGQYEEK
jgi:hypothetical protein